MRTSKAALVIGIIGLLLAVVGCSKQVTGTALPDPIKVPLALAADGYGIVAGFDDAVARIEIFTEPQCSHCSALQREFGDQLQYFVSVGRLQITYRPLTFLDDGYDGYSSKVANALFLVPAGDAVTRHAVPALRPGALGQSGSRRAGVHRGQTARHRDRRRAARGRRRQHRQR